MHVQKSTVEFSISLSHDLDFGFKFIVVNCCKMCKFATIIIESKTWSLCIKVQTNSCARKLILLLDIC